MGWTMGWTMDWTMDSIMDSIMDPTNGLVALLLRSEKPGNKAMDSIIDIVLSAQTLASLIGNTRSWGEPGTRLHRPHKLSRRPCCLGCMHDSKTGVDVVTNLGERERDPH